jgi:aspartate kinase
MAQTINGYGAAHDSLYATQTWQRNTAPGGWIVQKFGGTSVGKFAVNIAEDIIK